MTKERIERARRLTRWEKSGGTLKRSENGPVYDRAEVDHILGLLIQRGTEAAQVYSMTKDPVDLGRMAEAAEVMALARKLMGE